MWEGRLAFEGKREKGEKGGEKERRSVEERGAQEAEVPRAGDGMSNE